MEFSEYSQFEWWQIRRQPRVGVEIDLGEVVRASWAHSGRRDGIIGCPGEISAWIAPAASECGFWRLKNHYGISTPVQSDVCGGGFSYLAPSHLH